MRLENRIGIVTGAGRNIGEAIARSFAHEGARVAVVDLREDSARAVAESINWARPGAAMALVADVSSGAEVERMISSVVKHSDDADFITAADLLADGGALAGSMPSPGRSR